MGWGTVETDRMKRQLNKGNFLNASVTGQCPVHPSGKRYLKSEEWGYQNSRAGDLREVIETTWKAKQSALGFFLDWSHEALYPYDFLFWRQKSSSSQGGWRARCWESKKVFDSWGKPQEQDSQNKCTKTDASATQSLSQLLSVAWVAAFLKPRPQKPWTRWQKGKKGEKKIIKKKRRQTF